MNKTRLENLSDGVFAIVFTLLVLDIRIPDALEHATSPELYAAIGALGPFFVGYIISFFVLTMFWTSHSFFFTDVVKEINRQLVGLNMLYLLFVGLIPFSATLLSRFGDTQAAVLLYGANVLAIALSAALRFEYALASAEIDTAHNTPRLVKQARVRLYLTPAFTLFGMLVSFMSLPLALFCYAFPLVFNIIPGLLNATERALGFKL
jgi:uncharacterized membrane protein